MRFNRLRSVNADLSSQSVRHITNQSCVHVYSNDRIVEVGQSGIEEILCIKANDLPSIFGLTAML